MWMAVMVSYEDLLSQTDINQKWVQGIGCIAYGKYPQQITCSTFCHFTALFQNDFNSIFTSILHTKPLSLHQIFSHLQMMEAIVLTGIFN